MRVMELTPLQRAIRKLGSQKALADALGVRSPSVSEWKSRGVPAERCAQIEAATGGEVTRYELRPEIFGEDPAGIRAA